jgi:hypothetical protein
VPDSLPPIYSQPRLFDVDDIPRGPRPHPVLSHAQFSQGYVDSELLDSMYDRYGEEHTGGMGGELVNFPIGNNIEAHPAWDTRVDRAERGYTEKADMPPIVVSRSESHGDYLIDGNHRTLAARRIGFSHLPAIVTDYNPLSED